MDFSSLKEIIIMSEQINIFCVKWVPLEETWRHNGSMYLDAHVYDLRNQMFNEV